MTTPNGSLHRQHGGLDAAPQPQSSAAAPNAAEAGASEANRGLLKGTSASNGSPDETLQVGYTFTLLRPFRCITQPPHPYSWHIGNSGRYRKVHEQLLTQSRHSPLLVRSPRATIQNSFRQGISVNKQQRKRCSIHVHPSIHVQQWTPKWMGPTAEASASLLKQALQMRAVLNTSPPAIPPQVVHRARPPVAPEHVRVPAMSIGAPPGPRGGRRAPVLAPRPSSNDADETVPLINGGLAAKALRGRQSIAPQRVSPCKHVCV